MGHTVFYRSGLLAVTAVVVALVVWPVTSEAQLGDVTGTITGTTSNLIGTITGTTGTMTGDPNQTIGIPGGVLIINEQQVGSDGTMVVNALHAVVSGIADVVVASAMAGRSGGSATALQASY